MQTMIKDADVANCLVTWAEHGAATIARLVNENKGLREQVGALEALLSPPALIPIADVPVRVVTGIAVDEERE
tara:strand:- start:5046 stop:5264 length:219 start_codon:yes stop_codon:yes gene_type:complete